MARCTRSTTKKLDSGKLVAAAEGKTIPKVARVLRCQEQAGGKRNGNDHEGNRSQIEQESEKEESHLRPNPKVHPKPKQNERERAHEQRQVQKEGARENDKQKEKERREVNAVTRKRHRVSEAKTGGALDESDEEDGVVKLHDEEVKGVETKVHDDADSDGEKDADSDLGDKKNSASDNPEILDQHHQRQLRKRMHGPKRMSQTRQQKGQGEGEEQQPTEQQQRKQSVRFQMQVQRPYQRHCGNERVSSEKPSGFESSLEKGGTPRSSKLREPSPDGKEDKDVVDCFPNVRSDGASDITADEAKRQCGNGKLCIRSTLVPTGSCRDCSSWIHIDCGHPVGNNEIICCICRWKTDNDFLPNTNVRLKSVKQVFQYMKDMEVLTPKKRDWSSEDDSELRNVIQNYITDERPDGTKSVNSKKLYNLFSYSGPPLEKEKKESEKDKNQSLKRKTRTVEKESPEENWPLFEFFVHRGMVFALEPGSKEKLEAFRERYKLLVNSEDYKRDHKALRDEVIDYIKTKTNDNVEEEENDSELLSRLDLKSEKSEAVLRLQDYVHMENELDTFKVTDLVKAIQECLTVPNDYRGFTCPKGCGMYFPSRIWLDAHLDDHANKRECPNGYVCRPLHWPLGFMISSQTALMLCRLRWRNCSPFPILNPDIRPLHCGRGMNPTRGRAREGDSANSKIQTILYPKGNVPSRPSDALFQFIANVPDNEIGGDVSPLEPPLVNMAFLIPKRHWPDDLRHFLHRYESKRGR